VDIFVIRRGKTTGMSVTFQNFEVMLDKKHRKGIHDLVSD